MPVARNGRRALGWEVFANARVERCDVARRRKQAQGCGESVRLDRRVRGAVE